MKIVCVPYQCLCELETFTINGIKAIYEDFGDKVDCDEKAAEPYGCGDMRFLKRPAQPRILDKYHITETEYESICDELEKALSFGKCGWCI